MKQICKHAVPYQTHGKKKRRSCEAEARATEDGRRLARDVLVLQGRTIPDTCTVAAEW